MKKKESRDEMIERYMKLTRRDLAIMLTDVKILSDVLEKKTRAGYKQFVKTVLKSN